MKTISIKIFRWILRVLSGVIILFSIIWFIGSLGDYSDDSMSANAILQLSITGIGLMGLGLAWKWDLIGGCISLAAYLLLAIINPTVLNFSLVFIWPAIAILFIVLWSISGNITVKKL